ncbi:MAG: hypothetical protein H8E66_32740 [Planctomycetes bacterium]|nr:hypothetical protein [Planctomycetota bacterium]
MTDHAPNPVPGLDKLKDGYKIERSETVTPPIVLNVTKTDWWVELVGGIWTQQEQVTNSVEDGPWAGDAGIDMDPGMGVDPDPADCPFNDLCM